MLVHDSKYIWLNSAISGKKPWFFLVTVDILSCKNKNTRLNNVARFLNRATKTMEKNMDDRWLSVDDIGEYLGIKRDTVYKWIREKGLPAHKIGRLWKFKSDKVDQWVREGGAADKPEKDQQ